MEKYNLYIDSYNLYIILNQSIEEIMEKTQSDLSYGQYVILKYLDAGSEKKMMQRDLDHFAYIRRATLSQNLKALRKKGYIDHQIVSGNQRCKEILLTKKAEQVISRIDREIAEKLNTDIQVSDLKTLHSFIYAIKKKVQKKKGDIL